MPSEGLARLIHAPLDPDYVEAFIELAHLNMEIQERGPSAERMIRKSILEMDVGNYLAARSAARQATTLGPQRAESHYQYGAALAVLALYRTGAIPAGPGHQGPVDVSLRDLLEEARTAFRAAVDLCPSDEEALEDLEAIEALLGDDPTEEDLFERLAEGD